MKVNKSVIQVIIIALITISFSMTVYAEEVVGSHDTGVEISFLPNIGVTPPVDPEDPGTETGEPGTNQPGPLSLDWVPALKFGASHAVTSAVQSYNTMTTHPYIQISDLRGSGSGWKVTAALSSFTSNETASLLGAYISLAKGRTNTATTGITPPVPADPVKLTSDGEIASVATASDLTRAGRGTWVIRWYPVGGESDVQLTVPAAAATVGTHTATITWTLYDAP